MRNYKKNDKIACCVSPKRRCRQFTIPKNYRRFGF
jgi:hypothetical protein